MSGAKSVSLVPRYDARKKEGGTLCVTGEVWAVCYANSGETIAVTGPTDCQYCEAEAKARALVSILNRAHTLALEQARSHA